jgi:hypothetical protein
MEKPNQIFPLRIPPSTRKQLEELAKADGISMNQYICVALVEKIVRSERFLDPETGAAQRADPGFSAAQKHRPMLFAESA